MLYRDIEAFRNRYIYNFIHHKVKGGEQQLNKYTAMENDNRETDKILINLHSLSVYRIASIMVGLFIVVLSKFVSSFFYMANVDIVLANRGGFVNVAVRSTTLAVTNGT